MRAAAGASKTLEIHWFSARAARAAARRAPGTGNMMPKPLEKHWKNKQKPVCSKRRAPGGARRPAPGSAADPTEPFEKPCKNNRFPPDPPPPRGPPGGGAGEVPGPVTPSPKPFEKQWKMNKTLRTANGGRPASSPESGRRRRGRGPGTGRTPLETVRKPMVIQQKVVCSKWRSHRRMSVRVNGGPPETRCTLLYTERWTLVLSD